MKKLLPACVLAVAFLATSQQKASAYFNFSVGGSAYLNLSWGCNKYACCEPGGFAPYAFPGYGAYAYPIHASSGLSYDGGQITTAPQAPPPVKTQPTQYQSTWYGNSGYQPVGYYYPYSAPYGYYPNAGYGYYQAPSYWYGR